MRGEWGRKGPGGDRGRKREDEKEKMRRRFNYSKRSGDVRKRDEGKERRRGEDRKG